jgi:hypothetical protein
MNLFGWGINTLHWRYDTSLRMNCDATHRSWDVIRVTSYFTLYRYHNLVKKTNLDIINYGKVGMGEDYL